MDIEYYKKSNGGCPVADYIKKQPKRDQILIVNQIDQLAEYGLGLKRPQVGYLRDHIRELRIGQHRVLHFIICQDKAVLLHAITKKSQKVPDADIDKAIEYKADYLRNHPREGSES